MQHVISLWNLLRRCIALRTNLLSASQYCCFFEGAFHRDLKMLIYPIFSARWFFWSRFSSVGMGAFFFFFGRFSAFALFGAKKF